MILIITYFIYRPNFNRLIDYNRLNVAALSSFCLIQPPAGTMN